ncbi:MAG: hypothetical protein M1290_00830 [Candidatus Thermoplasmatota archaeon]|nr:hypothetical protein [Candidatus Thermoplasmatota archaeon]
MIEMKRSRDYSVNRRVYFKPEVDRRPFCGSKLRRDHIAWRKGIQSIKESMYATSYAFKCSRCSRTFRSSETDLISFPFRSYSIDVIVEIGYLRNEEKRSILEIHYRLTSRGIEISERKCYDLLHVLYELIAIRPIELDLEFISSAPKNGRVVLTIDGVQPERGNYPLYVIKDAMTSRVL